MAMYDPGQLYFDPILTGFSTGFPAQGYYAPRMFPLTPVQTQSGRYRTYDRSSWLIHDSRREPGTVANEIGGAKWSEDTFSTRERSLQGSVLDEERQQLQSQGGLANPVFGGDLQLDPEKDMTETLTGSILRAWEKEVADMIRDTGVYDGSHVVPLASGNLQWDDYTLNVSPTAPWDTISNPVADLRAAILRVYRDTLRYPNTLAIPVGVAQALEMHPRIVDRFKNFSLLNPDAFRLLTGFEGDIFVVDSVYNQANNVDATEDIVSFWGQDVWLGIVDATPGQHTKTFGKTFAQTYPSGDVRVTDRWREEPRKADLIRVSQKYDLKVVSPEAGFLFTDAIADPDA